MSTTSDAARAEAWAKFAETMRAETGVLVKQAVAVNRSVAALAELVRAQIAAGMRIDSEFRWNGTALEVRNAVGDWVPGPDLKGSPGNISNSGATQLGNVPVWGATDGSVLMDSGKPPFSESYDDLTDLPTLGTAAALDTGTAEGDVPILGPDGKLNTDVIPALALVNAYAVADETEMLALDAQPGDIAVRADESATYILAGTDPAELSDWLLLATPTDAVSSVAGRTGAVTLAVADITDMSANGRSLVAAANYAAMKTLLAVAAADITDATANGRSLVTAANYAAMKTLLAVALADITDASANGRSLVGAANYAAMRTLLGDDALKTTISTTTTADATHRGKVLEATGSYTINLTAAATLGSGWWCTIAPPTSGIVTIDGASTELIDGRETIRVYPGEPAFELWCDGAKFITKGRARQVTIISQTLGSPAATVDLETGFDDAEFRRIEIDVIGLSHNDGSAQAPYLTVKKSGVYEGSGYYATLSGSTTSASAGNTVILLHPGSLILSVLINVGVIIRNPASPAASGQMIQVFSSVQADETAGKYQVIGGQTTAAALQGVRFGFSAGSVDSGTFTAVGYR